VHHRSQPEGPWPLLLHTWVVGCGRNPFGLVHLPHGWGLQPQDLPHAGPHLLPGLTVPGTAWEMGSAVVYYRSLHLSYRIGDRLGWVLWLGEWVQGVEIPHTAFTGWKGPHMNTLQHLSRGVLPPPPDPETAGAGAGTLHRFPSIAT